MNSYYYVGFLTEANYSEVIRSNKWSTNDRQNCDKIGMSAMLYRGGFFSWLIIMIAKPTYTDFIIFDKVTKLFFISGGSLLHICSVNAEISSGLLLANISLFSLQYRIKQLGSRKCLDLDGGGFWVIPSCWIAS